MGHIIVVECKVMRVFIFDINGNVRNKFTCSKYLEFPNGVCCNDKQEIFISDNRAHCIKVFSYEGQFLRTIGSEGKRTTKHPFLAESRISFSLGVTNYPIGVVQNSQGDVLIADNHNNFNLTIFSQGENLRHPRVSRGEERSDVKSLFRLTQFPWLQLCQSNLSRFRIDGQLISALESKVKHAQCFDVALMDDGSVVLASKDYRIYVYRYLMTPSGGNGSPPSPVSSSSTTPGSCHLNAGECLSPSMVNGHMENPFSILPSMANNGY